MESCQNPECKRKRFIFEVILNFVFSSEGDVIMSCTFDLANEICPLKTKNNRLIHNGTQADQTQPISDHTRGGKTKS
jgi:hypothetical protein